MNRWIVATSLFFSLGLVAASASGPLQLPDPSTGVIDGRDAALVWPARYRDAQSHELLPAEGCEVHLVRSTDLDTELIRPCGKWFVPDPGKYKVWLQGKDFISPEPMILNAVLGSTGRGRSMAAPVVPSGAIVLSSDVRVGAGEGVRLVSLKANFFHDFLRAFDRRLAEPERPAGMPAGSALAGIFDRKSGDAIALSRPLVVSAGRTTVARPTTPKRDSDVLIVLQKPIAPTREVLQLSLVTEAGPRHPDVFLHASDAVFAVWYEVQGTRATVSVASETWTLGPVALRLTPKRITTYRGVLTKKPTLKVSVLGRSDVFKKMRVGVERIGKPEPLRSAEVLPGMNEIEALPAEPLRVTLTADQWSFVRDVDLTDGADGEVTFVLEPIVATGTVYLAKEPARAHIAFEHGLRDLLETETDDQGRFEAVFWQKGMYAAKIKLDDDPSAPFIDPAVDIEHTRTLDFHLPRNRIVTRVFNADTGLPIASASIGVLSEATHDAVGEMTLAYRYTADEEGVLVLPRLRPGHARIDASAPDFAPSEPQRIDVDATTERELSFPLEPLSTARVRVVLPGGVPAVGAEAITLSDLVTGRPTWRGSAGADGELAIGARGPNEIVIVRHPNASTRALLMNQVGETIDLGPADLAPLVVRSTDTAGAAVRFALVTVWIDGMRLTDSAAAFATWSNAGMTDAEGVWTARNLPPTSIRLLATKTVTPAQIAAGAYDSLAQTVPHPRPRLVALRVVE